MLRWKPWCNCLDCHEFSADALFKGEEMAMGGVMVGDQTVMGSMGAEHEAARSFLMTGTGRTGTGV